MQATVSAFDAETRTGRVLLDDGVEMRFTGAALAGTGLRLLRPGQRVRLSLTGDPGRPVIESLQILTLS